MCQNDITVGTRSDPSLFFCTIGITHWRRKIGLQDPKCTRTKQGNLHFPTNVTSFLTSFSRDMHLNFYLLDTFYVSLSTDVFSWLGSIASRKLTRILPVSVNALTGRQVFLILKLKWSFNIVISIYVIILYLNKITDEAVNALGCRRLVMWNKRRSPCLRYTVFKLAKRFFDSSDTELHGYRRRANLIAIRCVMWTLLR